jgi:PAS domain S-box-containing protein
MSTYITERKRAEMALEKRMVALTPPLRDAVDITFETLFNLRDIQRLQDEFAKATGVASIITHPDGTPITAPSNFCRLCSDIIRKTDKGRANCYCSDALIGQLSSHGPTIQQCMSGGLWDAGAGIEVGGKHIANWLIGQVRDVTQTEEKIRAYAREIGADEEAVASAFRDVTPMSFERFGQVAQMVFTLARQLSSMAYQNVKQARFITERKQAELEREKFVTLLESKNKELQESYAKHERLVDNLIDAFLYRHDVEEVFNYVSSSVTGVLGYSKEKFLTHFADLLTDHPINVEAIKHTKQSIKGIQQQPYEIQVYHNDRSIRWLEVSESPVRDDDGKVVAVEGVAHNITERKQLEEILAARVRFIEYSTGHSSEELLQTFLDEAERLTGSTIGFFHFLEDDQETISLQMWSTNTLKNMCTAEGKGQHYNLSSAGVWADCIRKREPIIHNDYASLPSKKGFQEGHAPIIREMVTTVFREDKIVAILGVGNKECNYDQRDLKVITDLADMAWDIIGRKRVEEDRKKLIKTLQFKNKELRDIVYTASHDLKSPLINIEGFSGELKASCVHLVKLFEDQSAGVNKSRQIEALIKEDIPQCLKFITSGAKKMASLLDGLQQISRIGALKIHSESLDINRIVREVVDAVEHQKKANNITVTVEALPGCIGDTHMLDLVFTNFISNAIKYRDPEKEGLIKISGRVKDSMSIYCVQDNGIGIAAGHQEKIFGIFCRLSPEGSAGGEGLGLAIVIRIMDRLGGKTWVESELGKGSRFFIALPTAAMPID